MPELKLYSAAVCPFAQRTRLTLREKGLDFEVVEIDLTNKPAWFPEVSPYGKVPVLVHGEDRVWESAIINEYLDETFPDPPLMPASPGERAAVRIWIDFLGSRFVPSFYKLLTSQDAAEQEKRRGHVEENLRFLETEGIGRLSGEGPYWTGSSPMLVDLAMYPFFERLVVLEHYRGVSLPDDCTQLRAWKQAMEKRESVVAIRQEPEFFVRQYARYAAGTP